MVERLVVVMNAHDPQRMAALFAPHYRSGQPVHPARGFGGRQQVQANWTAVFDAADDDIDAAVLELYRPPPG